MDSGLSECGQTDSGQTECGSKGTAKGNVTYRNAAKRNDTVEGVPRLDIVTWPLGWDWPRLFYGAGKLLGTTVTDTLSDSVTGLEFLDP